MVVTTTTTGCGGDHSRIGQFCIFVWAALLCKLSHYVNISLQFVLVGKLHRKMQEHIFTGAYR